MNYTRIRTTAEPRHVWLALATGLAAGPAAYLLFRGIREDAAAHAVAGVLILVPAAMIVLYLAVGRRLAGDGEATVGKLSDVLANLGTEIRAANELTRERDAIRWVNGQLTVSVAVEANASGGFDFKVMNGQASGKAAHTTTIQMNLWPADPSVEVVGGV